MSSIQQQGTIIPLKEVDSDDVIGTSKYGRRGLEEKCGWGKKLRSMLARKSKNQVKKATSCPDSFSLVEIQESSLYHPFIQKTNQSELAYSCKNINKEPNEIQDQTTYFDSSQAVILKVVLKEGKVFLLLAPESDINNNYLTKFPIAKPDKRMEAILWLTEREKSRLLIYEFPVEKSEKEMMEKLAECNPEHIIVYMDDDHSSFMAALDSLIADANSIEFTKFPNDNTGIVVAEMAKQAKQFVFNLPVSVDLFRGCLQQNSSVTCVKFKHGCIRDENGDKLLGVVAASGRQLDEIHFREAYLTGAGVLNFIKKADQFASRMFTVYVEILIRSKEESRKIRNVAYMKRENRSKEELFFRIFHQFDHDEVVEKSQGENNGRFNIEIFYAKNLTVN